MNVEPLYNNLNRRVGTTQTQLMRYSYASIDWDDRLIAIKGPRGCGKTTLILQHIKKDFKNRDNLLYISLDDLWFANNNVVELIDMLYAQGLTHIFIDEVHYYSHWKQLIKNLYDNYPNLHIVYTGSSMLEIEKSRVDLSRRQIMYEMQGLSFREYLLFENLLEMPTVTLDNLLENHQQIAEQVVARLGGINEKVLPLFGKYLEMGYYPFYKDVKRGYHSRLKEVANLIIEQDYPKIEDVSQSTIQKMRKMLMVLANRVPQTPNMVELCRELETDRNQGLKMLNALEKGGLLGLLSKETKTLKHLARPDKIYLNNTNLMYALVTNPDIGTIRETFFFNQLSQSHSLLYPAEGDFKVDGKYTFEVGGKGKSFTQIKDLPASYLAVDGIEIGHHNRIPLWMFGLLY